MPTTKTLVDTDSAQTLTNKTLTAPVLTAAAVALAAAPSAALDAATKGYVDGLNVNPINNGSLAASVSGNVLTVALKTASGGTPSATDPVRITFRSATDTNGALVTRTVTAAITLTCASGSTLGMVSAIAARLWVGLIDNSGTVELCLWNPLHGTTFAIKAFTPNTDVTTTAEGSGTATSAQVLYSTNARSTVPFVLLGFLEITEAAAGVWATAPTVVQTYRDGYRKTGDRVQVQLLVDGAVATGTTTIPNDDTIPQITEGNQVMTLAVTPTSIMNLLNIQHIGYYANSNTDASFVSALFQDAVSNALAVMVGGSATSGGARTSVSFMHTMLAGTISSTTFRIRTGNVSAGTLTFNGAGGVRDFGGKIVSRLMVEEVYV